MAAKVEQNYKERATSIDRWGRYTSVEVPYIVFEVADEDAALTAVLNTAPKTLHSLPLDAIEIDSREGNTTFKVNATYRAETTTDSYGDDEEDEESTISFDCGAGTKHVSFAIDQRIAYGSIDAGGAIGWNGKHGTEMEIAGVDILSEYLNKEKIRWRSILGDDELVDSYLRILSVACATGYFNITDVRGNYYLEEDAKKLTEFFDRKSGRPGADNLFADLFVRMDNPAEDGDEDSPVELIACSGTKSGKKDEEDIVQEMTLDDEDRFAYSTPYIKLDTDPQVVYLMMLEKSGIAEDDELAELKRIREEWERHEESLPDHAWIIEPIFPDIIKEFIVAYSVNDRDIVRFTKLARSNSVLGLLDFIPRALKDWKSKPVFQRMAVIPPAEMLNYFEYYASLLVSLYDVEDLKTVEQALIDSAPCFPKYEMELWKRISIVLIHRGDANRLYDSACGFVKYLNSLDGLASIREEAANVIESYCVGLHNAKVPEKQEDFLGKCESAVLKSSNNAKLGNALFRKRSRMKQER